MQKGQRNHKCKGCGKLRSTQGDYCQTCINERLEENRSVTITRQMDAKEFWGAIFGANPESFGDWMDFEFLGDADWDKPGLVKLIDLENEAQIKEIVIGVNSLAKAYSDLWTTGGVHPSYLDLDNMDCVGSDAVLQQALYGKVVFG